MTDNDFIKALSQLSAKKLAKTLWEHAQTDEGLYEKCRLLAASKEEGKLETMIRNKIASLSSSSHFYDWRHAQSFASELEHLSESIVSDVLPKNPELAAELLEDFVLCDGAIIESVDDSSGWVGDSLRFVVKNWGLAWEKIASPDSTVLADKVLSAFMGNEYGILDEILHDFSKALGKKGIEHIEQALKEKLKIKNSDEYYPFKIRIGLTGIAEIKHDMEMYIEYVTDS